MKKVAKILVLLLAAALMLSTLPAFAANAPQSVEKIDRFTVVDSSANTDSAFSMLSSDGQLVINIAGSTPVTFEDGAQARELLQNGQTLAQLMDGRMLDVTYSVSTSSMPPQSSPDGVVILFETAVPLPADLTAVSGLMQERFDLLGTDTGSGVFSMLSQSGALNIHINPLIPITFEDGLSVRDSLADGQSLANLLDGRMLEVTYSAVAMSLPPQSTPTGIVVMYEKAVPLPETVTGDTVPLNGEVVVKGAILDAPAPFVTADNTVMVPLRAVAEALGFNVTWDGSNGSVRLGNAITLFLGLDYYTVGRMAPLQLGTAPELVNGFTYVPLKFFSTVTAEYDAYVLEGQVVIDRAGDMS